MSIQIPNLELIKVFALRTVVLVRNIFDVVVSIYDFVHPENFRGPAGYITEDFFAFDAEKKMDMLIDIGVPWYIGFFVSWKEAYVGRQNDLHWVTYETMIADEVNAVRDVLFKDAEKVRRTL